MKKMTKSQAQEIIRAAQACSSRDDRCLLLYAHSQKVGEATLVRLIGGIREPGFSKSTVRRDIATGKRMSYVPPELVMTKRAKPEEKQLSLGLEGTRQIAGFPLALTQGQWLDVVPLGDAMGLTEKVLLAAAKSKKWMTGLYRTGFSSALCVREDKIFAFFASLDRSMIPNQAVLDRVLSAEIFPKETAVVHATRASSLDIVSRGVNTLFTEVHTLHEKIESLCNLFKGNGAIPIGERATLVPLIDKELKGFSASSIADEVSSAYSVPISIHAVRHVAICAGLIGDEDYGYYSEHHTSAFGASGAHWRFNDKGRSILYNHLEDYAHAVTVRACEKGEDLSPKEAKEIFNAMSIPHLGNGKATALTLPKAEMPRHQPLEKELS